MIDIQYLLFLQHLRELTNGIFNYFFLFITDLGWSALPVLIACFIYWSINKRAGRYIFTTINLADYTANFIKVTVCAYRPWVRSADIHPVEAAKVTATGYSFPSGHTTVGTSLWGGIGITWRDNKIIRRMVILIILLIGFSRNYLGVHTPQDVLVGLTVASFYLWAVRKLLAWIDEKPDRIKWMLWGSVVLAIGITLYANLKSYPMDYVDGVLLVDPKKLALDGFGVGGNILGFGIGIYLEQKFVHFTTDGISMENRIVRCLTGGLIEIVFFYLSASLLNLILPAWAAKVLGGVLNYIFILYLHPYLFQKREQKAITK